MTVSPMNALLPDRSNTPSTPNTGLLRGRSLIMLMQRTLLAYDVIWLSMAIEADAGRY